MPAATKQRAFLLFLAVRRSWNPPVHLQLSLRAKRCLTKIARLHNFPAAVTSFIPSYFALYAGDLEILRAWQGFVASLLARTASVGIRFTPN